MKTIVFQTFRETDVPSYISLCMDSVQNWASSQNFEYAFINDSFLDLYPRDLDQGYHICVKTDLARLKYAKAKLESGEYDRAIWFDADLLIFDPAFRIPNSDFLLCKEQFIHSYLHTFGFKAWAARKAFDFLGQFHRSLQPVRKTINNSVISCNTRGLDVLNMLLAVTEATIRRSHDLGKLDAGTTIFAYMKEFFPFELVEQVAIVFRSQNHERIVHQLLSGGFQAVNISFSSKQNLEDYQNLCFALLNSAPQSGPESAPGASD